MAIKGYVDMHAHIIPGVDDGSQSLEDSIRMLEMAYAEGVRTMYATPHFGSGKERYDSAKLKERFSQVEKAAKEIGEEGIQLILGNEITYSPGVEDKIIDGTALTMGGTRYVLMEFDYGASFKAIYKGLQQIITAGYRPILAHIERYYCLNKKFDDIITLRELGVALQINTASVIPRLSQEAKFCRKLIREGYIQFLGSDCHSPEWRPPVMKQAIDVLVKKTPEKYMDRILKRNPDKMFNNEFI